MSYELYVIAAWVIGGTSLQGGVGAISGTMIGALIIGTLCAGATGRLAKILAGSGHRDHHCRSRGVGSVAQSLPRQELTSRYP